MPDSDFLRLGLVGCPLEHSLSPRMHAANLAALHLPGEYRLYPIPPLPEGQSALAELLGRLRRGELHGLNVTIPHKQNVIPLLDELTPTARAVGAVNTLVMHAGRLVGDNTDVPGFLADLEKELGGWMPESTWHGRRALVLGAGGSARAVVYALGRAGWQVSVASRRLEQAQELVAFFQAVPLPVTPLVLEPATLQQAYALVVNTTPLGMSPNAHTSPWLSGVAFPPGATLYDLVYNPAETSLLRQARACGLVAANGLGMLVEQAALSFQIWSGQFPPRQAMWDTLSESRV